MVACFSEHMLPQSSELFFCAMATVFITRPAYKLSRSPSFENAVPPIPPFHLAPLPRRSVKSVEDVIISLRSVVGKTLADAVLVVWRLISKRLETFQRDLERQLFCWLFNPNAILLFVFWPGWVFVGLAYWCWSR